MKTTMVPIRFRPISYLVAASMAAAAIISGCSTTTTTTTTSSSSPSGASAPGAGTKMSLGFVTNSSSSFFTLAVKGIAQAEKENPNVSVQVEMPADASAATQKSEIDDMLAKGVQGIATDPVDPVNQVPYINTVAQSVPVITFDSDAPSSNRLMYIGSDNVAAGKLEGQMIVKALPQGGKIMLFVGHRDAQNAHDREEGIREGIADSKVTIIDVRTDDTDHARAKQNAADTLTAYPDVDALVGLWNYNGPAILSAVQDADKVGKVKILCFDDDPATLAGVKSGAIYGTVVQQPYQFGYKTVKELSAIVAGDKSGIPPGKLDIIPVQFITSQNVDAYQQTIKQELSGS